MADIEKLVGDESRLELGQKVNEIIDNKVSKTGDTMDEGAYLILQNQDANTYCGITVANNFADSTQTSLSAQENYMIFRCADKNGKGVGEMLTKHTTNGSVQSVLRAFNTPTGKQSEIAVTIEANGTAYATAPTPASNDNTTKIATTAFVKQAADGQWVFKQTVINNNTNKAKGSYTYDVSSYLPKDGRLYEVMVHGRGYDTADADCVCRVSSDAFGGASPTISNVYAQILTTGYSNSGVNDFILPVGTGRKIYYTVATTDFDSLYIVLLGYRRIGTNS